MASAKKKSVPVEDPAAEWPFGKKNYVLLGISLVIIIVGFICLGSGDDANDAITLTIAPILLVIGYALIPFAIMARDKSVETEPKGEEAS